MYEQLPDDCFKETFQIPYRPRVIVRLREDAMGDWKSPGFSYKISSCPFWAAWQQVLPEVRVRCLFHSLTTRSLKKLMFDFVEKHLEEKPPNLFSYFVLDHPGVDSVPGILEVVSGLVGLERAYWEAAPCSPPSVVATGNPLFGQQGYLAAAPQGIGAESAWKRQGGDGQGIKLVDIEQGWNFDHVDIRGCLISGLNYCFLGHGTCALGVIASKDDQTGCVGIAPHLDEVWSVSQWRNDFKYNTADAIMRAASVLGYGDVILLEAQIEAADCCCIPEVPEIGSFNFPIESQDDVCDAIHVVTGAGKVVVAAGNGGCNLDEARDYGGRRIFRRGSNEFRDSGAIMVGACKPDNPPYKRLGESNYGSRVDCFSWGDHIMAPGCRLDGAAIDVYTNRFDGTSGAAAIIAGVVAVIQGIAAAALGSKFSPQDMRTLISRADLGTPSRSSDDQIGVMPDLEAVMSKIFHF